ncbi:MAG: hypothetical protein RBS39_05405 [Phycisphaerales bacterium]|jgi:hypothetical protein|nr:hypothetical protein [Phycisphaerales bacterium]
MQTTGIPRLSAPLDREIEEVSSSLRDAVLPIVEHLVGPSQRPAGLARRLNIDKSLTGRILRSIKSGDPFEVIHNAPAPTGLRIFIDAAAQAGVDQSLRDRAEASIRRFESLIEAFPAGRAALEAAISDHIPEVRSANERAAKQAAFKSMSYLLGYQAEASFHSCILTPSADGMAVDSTHIAGLRGLCRLRGRSPINIFGIRRTGADAPTTSWMETLDGERDSRDAAHYLMPDFCDKPVPDLSVIVDGVLTQTVLDATSLPVNTPTNLVNAWIGRRAMDRYRSDQRQFVRHVGLLRIPCRYRVQDYFVHEDVLPGTPSIRPRIHGLSGDSVDRPEREQDIDEIDLSVPTESLGMGLDMPELRSPASPRYRAIMRSVFERSNLRPEQFRVYRASMVYPVPFVSLIAWFKLPERPAGL